MRIAIAALVGLLAFPAAAADLVTPGEFRDYAEGWTLYFEREGERWGEEQFLPGGGTVWRFQDGTCAEGAWREYDGQVCFYYGTAEEGVLCWQMLRDEQGLFAKLMSNVEGQGMELRITGRDRVPPLCGGPSQSL